MNSYLIPANTKRGKLIFGLFRGIDLIIFGCGLITTFILVLTLPLDTTFMVIMALLPALVCALLVAPVPYYHNVMTVLIEAYEFITDRQKFVWKGWCVTHESTKEE